MTRYSTRWLEYLILTAIEVDNNEVDSLGDSDNESNLGL